MQKNIEKFSLKRLLVRKQALLMALLIALLMALWVQLPRLLDPYAVEDDFRNLYWVHQYRNPELFPRDQILVHDVNQEVAPGYAVLFRLGTALVSPILLHKLLIFPLMLIAVYYVYRIVEQMAGERAALVAGVAFAVFNLTAGTEISATSGLQRSFALPLLAAFAYYLMRRRHPIAAVIVFSSGVIYFPAVPTMAITYVLSCLSLSKGESRRLVISWRPLAYLLFALFAAVALVMPVLMWQAGKAFSTPDNASEKVHFLQDPAYAGGGGVFSFISSRSWVAVAS